MTVVTLAPESQERERERERERICIPTNFDLGLPGFPLVNLVVTYLQQVSQLAL